jgi:hypothetical protein
MRSNKTVRPLALALAVSGAALAPGRGRGDTVDVNSTTMLIVRDEARAGTTYTAVPVYELLSVSARNIENPIADDLKVIVSTWAGLSLGKNLVWYDNNPPVYRVFGDLDLAYVQGELLKRAVQLRVGRQIAAGGVVGSIQIDGASTLVRLPYGFGVSGFVGAPVSQRFLAPGGDATWNPERGSLATGGRLSYALPPWGEVGVSTAYIQDRDAPGRRWVGGDLRVTPLKPLTLLASTNYDYYEARWVETRLLGQYQALPKLLVTADYRHVDPDLLLPRSSILSVFAVDRRNEVGVGAEYGPWKRITFGGDYHYLKDEGSSGHRVSARATWRPAPDTALGAEIGFLSHYQSPSGAYLNNGYFMGRVFGSKTIERFTGTVDLQDYGFQQRINDVRNSFIGTATIAYAVGWGFAALASGTGAVTPYYENRFEIMAKLAYNQSYHQREVR